MTLDERPELHRNRNQTWLPIGHNERLALGSLELVGELIESSARLSSQYWPIDQIRQRRAFHRITRSLQPFMLATSVPQQDLSSPGSYVRHPKGSPPPKEQY
jgi:hypothetical protein